MAIIQIVRNKVYKIEVSIGKKDGKYQRYYENFHGKKSEAEARESELKRQVKAGGIIADRKITFEEFSEKWLKEYASNLAPRTYNEYKKLLQKINKNIGNIPLFELKPLHLAEYYNNLRRTNKENPHNKKDKTQATNKPLTENTVLHHYTLISGILNKAVDWEFLEKNPNEKVPRPKIQKHEPNFYDKEQVQELLKCLTNEPLRTKAIIMLTLDTGARRGEITGLNWEDIDLQNGYISINKITQVVNGDIIEKEPKTQSSIRKVPITSKTVEILKQYKKEQAEKELLLGSKWQKTPKVFTGDMGGYMYPPYPSQIFEKFLQKYNLPKITFHELRHTSVSLLINAGIQAQVISKRVGHSTTATTNNIYAHVFNSSEQEVVEKMSNIFEAF